MRIKINEHIILRSAQKKDTVLRWREFALVTVALPQY